MDPKQIILPCITLNGTSANMLFDHYSEARYSIMAVREQIAAIEFHSRDYMWYVAESPFSTSHRLELHVGTGRRTYAVVYADRANRLEVNTARQTADLIAAAPDLLAALKEFAGLADFTRPTERAAWLNARAAIARAESTAGNTTGGSAQ